MILESTKLQMQIELADEPQPMSIPVASSPAFTFKVMSGSSSTTKILFFLVLLLLFWSGNTYDYCNKQTNKQTLGIRLTI